MYTQQGKTIESKVKPRKSNLEVLALHETSDQGLRTARLIVLLSLSILPTGFFWTSANFWYYVPACTILVIWACSAYFGHLSREERRRQTSEMNVSDKLADQAPPKSIVSRAEFLDWFTNETAKVYGGYGVLSAIEQPSQDQLEALHRGDVFVQYSRLFEVVHVSDSLVQSAIATKFNELTARRPLLGPVLEILRNKHMAEITYHSNRIEGHPFTFKETELVVDILMSGHEYGTSKFLTTLEYLRSLEVVNHVNAWRGAMTLVAKRSCEITLTDIFMIQQFVCPEAFGLRSQREEVVSISRTKVLLAMPVEVQPLMTRLLDWFRAEISRDTAHIVDVVIAFHARFTRIHPFRDGNGRTVRILTSLFLMQNQYPPLRMSSMIPNMYKDALYEWDIGNPTVFGEMMWRELDHAFDWYIAAITPSKSENN